MNLTPESIERAAKRARHAEDFCERLHLSHRKGFALMREQGIRLPRRAKLEQGQCPRGHDLTDPANVLVRDVMRSGRQTKQRLCAICAQKRPTLERPEVGQFVDQLLAIGDLLNQNPMPWERAQLKAEEARLLEQIRACSTQDMQRHAKTR